MSILLSLPYNQVDINGVDYRGAMAHYMLEKNKFFFEYAIAAQKTDEQVREEFQRQIIDEINANPIEDQENLINGLTEEVADYIYNKLLGINAPKGRPKGLTAYQKNLNQNYVNYIKKGEKNLSIAANNILSEKDLQSMIFDSLNKYQVKSTGYDTQVILNQMISLRNRIVAYIQIAKTKKPRMSSYERTGKGYAREAMVFKAYDKLNNIIDGKIHSISTGSKTFNDSNSETSMDEYIGFMDDIEGAFEIDANHNLNLGYGTQVKSWIAPWENNQKFDYIQFRYGYDIGSRVELLNSFKKEDQQNKYSWSKGVVFLGKTENTLLALGKQNIIFISGHAFYWTYDLIKNFRQMQYFLAFSFRHSPHEATAHVRWQQQDPQ